jgi:galactokinase
MNEQTCRGEQFELAERFARLWDGTPPLIVRAPGRVNLIGEHTDYNDGYVFPAAIGFETRVAIGERADRRMAVRSENNSEEMEFDLDNLPASRRGHWSDYVVGVARELEHEVGGLPAANMLLWGDVPQGAGLSSSASLEVAVCEAFLQLAKRRLDGDTAARLCQRAENEFVGARCGIMDQFISVYGKNDHALRLDCRSLQYELLPLPREVRMVICNSMVRHSVATGEYNKRRAECEAGAHYFAERIPGVRALRDVSLADLTKFGDGLSETVRKRCRHVISENARVLQAAAALGERDLRLFGRLMHESHLSMRDDFEISCSEIDVMVKLAENQEGAYGARMTGGGFGGCTINLVRAELVAEFCTAVSQGYERATRLKPEIYVTSAADGAGPLPQNSGAGAAPRS